MDFMVGQRPKLLLLTGRCLPVLPNVGGLLLWQCACSGLAGWTVWCTWEDMKEMPECLAAESERQGMQGGQQGVVWTDDEAWCAIMRL